MAKYKLKALNIHIGGKLFFKEENKIFDSKVFNPKDLIEAEKAGFIYEIKEEIEMPVVKEEIVKEKHKHNKDK